MVRFDESLVLKNNSKSIADLFTWVAEQCQNDHEYFVERIGDYTFRVHLSDYDERTEEDGILKAEPIDESQTMIRLLSLEWEGHDEEL